MSQDQFPTAYKQYHAMMLLRILIDNPGSCKYIAKNIDDKFKQSTKTMLRMHRDPSVQQIARETLDHFAREKSDVPELKPLLEMWVKEQGSAYAPMQKPHNVRRSLHQAAQQSGARAHSNGRPRHALPDPAELAGRIEEAKTSAKLLVQLVQSTPPSEFDSNELIREFADRCQTAQRSLHGYMNADPAPDEETFQTLIETCEQLNLASSKHQRAALSARRQTKDSLQRSGDLYNNQSRDTASGAAVPTSASQPRTSPTPPSQLNTLAPISRHTSPRNEPSAETSNPFVDENHLPYRSSSSQAQQNRQSYGGKSSPLTHHSPYAELPSTSTPPPKDSPFKTPALNGEAIAPPPGPPPLRKPVAPAGHDDNDPYTGLGAFEDQPPRRPLTSDSEDLYSAHDPVSHAVPQQAYANGIDHTYATGATALPDRGKGRVKDDEPFSTVGGVSGSGWNY